MKKFFSFLFCIIFIIGIFGGCAPEVNTPENDPIKESPVLKEEYKETVSLYFAKDNINSLAVEKRTVTAENKDGFYKKVIEELINGPQTDSLSLSVHPKTVVNSVVIKDSTAIADFTDSLKTYNTGGSTKEYMCLYSIVNTLCEFPEIKNVVITINGNLISTFGQLDTSEPLTSN